MTAAHPPLSGRGAWIARRAADALIVAAGLGLALPLIVVGL